MDEADNPVERLLTEGRQHYDAGRYDEAQKAFRQAADISESSSEAFFHLANTFFQMEELELAEANWLKAVELDPLQAAAYLNVGNLYFKRGNPVGAVRYWEMFRRLNKAHAAVCLNLGLAYDQLGDVEKAFEAYSAFLGLSPTSSEAARIKSRFDSARHAFGNNMIVAEKVLASGDIGKARAIYEKTLPMYPGGARIYKAYATILYKEGDDIGALKYYRKTRAHDPDDPTVLVNMGVIYEKHGEVIDALWAYTQALRAHGGMHAADRERVEERIESLRPRCYNRVSLYADHIDSLIRRAQYDEAREALGHLIELAPDWSEVAALKERMRGMHERIEEALDPALRAAKVFYSRGIDAQQAGRFDQALRFLGKYLQLCPHGPHATEAHERLDAMRKMMGAVVQSLLQSDDERG